MGTDLMIANSPDTPAYNALTDLQKKFVVALVQFGSGKGQRTKAARMAGYSGDDNTLHVVAWQNFHNPKIQAALREVTTAHMMSFQLMAVDGIASMAENARDESVKLRALLAIADRTGFVAAQQINHIHEDVNRSEDQLLDKLTALVLKHPDWITRIEEPRRSQIAMRIERIEKGLPKAVDAEFAVVERDPDADLLGE